MNVDEKANAAKQLRENEAFQMFVGEVHDAAIADFVNSAASDIETREEAHAILRALAEINRRLSVAENAKSINDRKGQHRGND